MVWLVVALLLSWVAWGPVVLVAAALALCVPRARWWVQDRIHVSRRVVGWTTGASLALVVSWGCASQEPKKGDWRDGHDSV